MVSKGFLDRIQQRLDATGQTANAASLKAGLDRDYIGDLFKGAVRSPRMQTVEKLAGALECDPEWLWYGDGEDPASIDSVAIEAREIVEGLPPHLKDNAMTVLRAFQDQAAAAKRPRRKRRA